MTRLSKYIHQDEAGLWLTEHEKDHMRISYKLKSVLYEHQSPFQHILVVDSHDFGKMLVLDGAVQTTTLDGFIYNEMIAHVPLTLHPHPEKVLIIGGGDCGVAREACKYAKLKEIVQVEIDEHVVRTCKQHLPEIAGREDDPRVQYVYADGVEYVKNAENEFDVIIIDSSDPVGPAVQLFEIDFYRNVKKALKPDGLMVCQSQSPIFHRDIMSQTYGNIRSLFPHVHMYTAVVPTYPGGLWSYTLGSNRPLPDLAAVTFDKPAQYVSTEIVRSCFGLPGFVRDSLKKAEEAAIK
jgi:spermidine synthase